MRLVPIFINLLLSAVAVATLATFAPWEYFLPISLVLTTLVLFGSIRSAIRNKGHHEEQREAFNVVPTFVSLFCAGTCFLYDIMYTMESWEQLLAILFMIPISGGLFFCISLLIWAMSSQIETSKTEIDIIVGTITAWVANAAILHIFCPQLLVVATKLLQNLI